MLKDNNVFLFNNIGYSVLNKTMQLIQPIQLSELISPGSETECLSDIIGGHVCDLYYYTHPYMIYGSVYCNCISPN